MPLWVTLQYFWPLNKVPSMIISLLVVLLLTSVSMTAEPDASKREEYNSFENHDCATDANKEIEMASGSTIPVSSSPEIIAETEYMFSKYNAIVEHGVARRKELNDQTTKFDIRLETGRASSESAHILSEQPAENTSNASVSFPNESPLMKLNRWPTNSSLLFAFVTNTELKNFGILPDYTAVTPGAGYISMADNTAGPSVGTFDDVSVTVNEITTRTSSVEKESVYIISTAKPAKPSVTTRSNAHDPPWISPQSNLETTNTYKSTEARSSLPPTFGHYEFSIDNYVGCFLSPASNFFDTKIYADIKAASGSFHFQAGKELQYMSRLSTCKIKLTVPSHLAVLFQPVNMSMSCGTAHLRLSTVTHYGFPAGKYSFCGESIRDVPNKVYIWSDKIVITLTTWSFLLGMGIRVNFTAIPYSAKPSLGRIRISENVGMLDFLLCNSDTS